MLPTASYLTRYAIFFGERNKEPLTQIELGGHIVYAIDRQVIHGFVNGVAGMVYSKRKERFPECDQRSDWLKSEKLFHEMHSPRDIRIFSIKCILLAGYTDCINKGLDLPSIDGAIGDLGVSDEKVLEALEGLDAIQCALLLHQACRVYIDDDAVELFLAREIAQFYLENEGEILRRFEISC